MPTVNTDAYRALLRKRRELDQEINELRAGIGYCPGYKVIGAYQGVDHIYCCLPKNHSGECDYDRRL